MNDPAKSLYGAAANRHRLCFKDRRSRSPRRNASVSSTAAGWSRHPNPSHPIRGTFAVGCASTASATEVAVIPDGVRLVPNVINNRRDGRRHAVPLRLQKSLPEAKLRSKGQAWEAGEQRGNTKDRDTAVKVECQARFLYEQRVALSLVREPRSGWGMPSMAMFRYRV